MRVYFLTISKNEVSFSATMRYIGSPWLKHIHVTDVSMCSGETNFIFIRDKQPHVSAIYSHLQAYYRFLIGEYI
jgi:hypothetical protein